MIPNDSGRFNIAPPPCRQEAPRYEVQVWIGSDATPVFDDDEVIAYSTDDPTWLSLTTLWEDCETVWMYPVSQIAEVRIRRRDE